MSRSGAVVIAGLIVLVCATLAPGQQPGGQVPLEQRFKQLDRNGDGKVSREEAGGAPLASRAAGSASG